MKLRNGEVFESKDALQRLVDRDDIPLKYAMPLMRMVKKLNEEIVLIEQKKNRLIKKYGAEDKEKQTIVVPPNTPEWDSFIKEFEELMSLEVDINITPVKLPETIIIPQKDLIFLTSYLEVEDVKN